MVFPGKGGGEWEEGISRAIHSESFACETHPPFSFKHTALSCLAIGEWGVSRPLPRVCSRCMTPVPEPFTSLFARPFVGLRVALRLVSCKAAACPLFPLSHSAPLLPPPSGQSKRDRSTHPTDTSPLTSHHKHATNGLKDSLNSNVAHLPSPSQGWRASNPINNE